MHWFFAALATGALTFVATNIDDIFILTLFFSQVNKRLHGWHIVAGQYLGFTALVLISLLGFVGGLIIPRAWIGLLGLVPILLGIRQWLGGGEDDEQESAEEEEVGALAKAGSWKAIAGVAAVTFANGGDNIGIYTPLFASINLPQLIVILSLFYMLLAALCYAGYLITRHRLVARTLARYGHWIVPFVLVALGIYIIIENGTLALFGLDW